MPFTFTFTKKGEPSKKKLKYESSFTVCHLILLNQKMKLVLSCDAQPLDVLRGDCLHVNYYLLTCDSSCYPRQTIVFPTPNSMYMTFSYYSQTFQNLLNENTLHCKASPSGCRTKKRCLDSSSNFRFIDLQHLQISLLYLFCEKTSLPF